VATVTGLLPEDAIDIPSGGGEGWLSNRYFFLEGFLCHPPIALIASENVHLGKPVTQETKRIFVTTMEQTHGRHLRRFLSSRMRGAAADVPDLIQEIYLRLLRIKDHEAIRNPQAYLYTVASHVLHQYTLSRAAAPEKMTPLQVVSELQAAARSSFAARLCDIDHESLRRSDPRADRPLRQVHFPFGPRVVNGVVA
jgi:hypothetical protein